MPPRSALARDSKPDAIDLLTLRVVIAVAECGSMSAGSDRVGLALGAVSARITSLEAALGVALFKRSSRGVALTAAGHLLVQRGREVLAGTDRLTLDLQDFARGRQGHVRMLANASAIIEYLPTRLERFRRAHPLIRVDLEERSSPEIPLAVLEGHADLGILDVPHPVQGLNFTDLFEDQLVLVVPHQHRHALARSVALADVIDEEFVGLPDGNAISGRMVATAALLGRPLAIRMQMRSFDAACRMVAGGGGVSVLPSQAIIPQLATLPIHAIPLSDSWARRTHQLVHREHLASDSATATLRRSLMTAMPA